VALIGASALVLAAAIPPLLSFYNPPRLTKDVPEQPRQAPTSSATAANLESGSSEYIGANLICWGRIPILPTGSARHIRTFAFKFPKPFTTTPTVTNGINVKGSGYSFAVYNADVTETGYTGALVEVNSRASEVPVSMNYTAIGTPQK
jgi:hypothetical protein